MPVGPGRGSGAGSLVAYALGITDLDPITYDLLFERFLNPERVSMPDFDIDFCQDGRDKVIDYVRRKYGEDCVSQIVTFGTMAARAVVRDCGRVLDLGYTFCDQIAKLIPVQPGRTITLADAREMEPLLAQREQKEDEVRELLALGEKLEGLTRNVGMHAGGVLIAPGKLTDFCPLYAAEGTTHAISQLDKDDVEAVGLVKFDFLGLTTLTILDWAERYVRALGEPQFSLERVPLDDKATYQLLSSGNTTAVFQLESRGMRDLIKRARPDRFEDVIALVALYRPGPMDLIPDFIARKHGQQRVEYLDKRLEPLLSPTYGIMVYQEQVMQIGQVIGGLTLGGADLLRRAMGKKKRRGDGAAARRVRRRRGEERPVEGQGDAALRPDGEVRGLRLQPLARRRLRAARLPDGLHEGAPWRRFHGRQPVAGDGRHRQGAPVLRGRARQRPRRAAARHQRLGLPLPAGRREDHPLWPGRGARHRASRRSARSWRRARPGRSPASLDLCRRVDKRIVNRRVLEALVRAGAFDVLERNRASLLSSVGRSLEAAEQAERAAAQVSLFGDADGARAGAELLIPAKAWDLRQLLLEEKAALGFALSGHLFSVYAREIAGFPRTPLARLSPAEQRVWLAGVVNSARTQMTRRGRMMAVLLDDGTAQVEVSVFNELFEKHRDKLKEDALLVVQGKVQRDDFAGGLRVTADELYDLPGLRARYAARLRLEMNGQADAKRLMDTLAPYRAEGACPGVRALCDRRRRLRRGSGRCLARASGRAADRAAGRLAGAGERAGRLLERRSLAARPAHLAGLAAQEVARAAVPGAPHSLGRVVAPLLREERAKHRVAGFGLLAARQRQASRRDRAARCQGELDQPRAQLRGIGAGAQRGAEAVLDAQCRVLAPRPAQERLLLGQGVPRFQPGERAAPLLQRGTHLGNQRLGGLGRHQEIHAAAAALRGRLGQLEAYRCRSGRGGLRQRSEIERQAVEGAEHAETAHRQPEQVRRAVAADAPQLAVDRDQGERAQVRHDRPAVGACGVGGDARAHCSALEGGAAVLGERAPGRAGLHFEQSASGVVAQHAVESRLVEASRSRRVGQHGLAQVARGTHAGEREALRREHGGLLESKGGPLFRRRLLRCNTKFRKYRITLLRVPCPAPTASLKR